MHLLKLMVLVGVLGILACGCAHTGGGYFEDMLVFPMTNDEVAELSAHDIVVIMRRAGFSDQQILDLGTDLRNNLATTGAAKVRTGQLVEAVYAIKGKYVHAASRRKGNFTYDLDKGHLILLSQNVNAARALIG